MTAVVVLCTCPDPSTAEELARALITQGLAACVNLLPRITSIYRWQGEVEQAEEQLLVIKTQTDVYPQLEELIVQRHPYQVPEIVALPIVQGLPAYLAWLTDALSPSSVSSP